ncbi:MAG: SCP family extracellular protein [Parcubacteria group bacterium GW2011_GWA1_42_7]|nr:MAG: SCP family extracellular protein [Parcubacteria group bacterium GW2011_GWA1_42_7]KKS91990.1 MAG: SCP family extracellular protein [Parcubacteria group bacterium GW2011_GWC1_43_12]
MKKYFTLITLISALLIPNFAPIKAEGLNAAEIVSLTNAQRQNNNLSQLQTSNLLQKAAQMKASDMAAKGYFAHNSPDGKTPWDWMASAGYNFKTAGENIALNYQTSQATVEGWMNSPGHRANILNGAFAQIGIGIASGNYNGKPSTFIVQMLAAPMGANRGDSIILNPPATPKPSIKPAPSAKPEPSPKPIAKKPAPIPTTSQAKQPAENKGSGTFESRVPDPLSPNLFCSMNEILAKKFTRISPAETPAPSIQKHPTLNNFFRMVKRIFIWPLWDN